MGGGGAGVVFREKIAWEEKKNLFATEREKHVMRKEKRRMMRRAGKDTSDRWVMGVAEEKQRIEEVEVELNLGALFVDETKNAHAAFTKGTHLAKKDDWDDKTRGDNWDTSTDDSDIIEGVDDVGEDSDDF